VDTFKNKSGLCPLLYLTRAENAEKFLGCGQKKWAFARFLKQKWAEKIDKNWSKIAKKRQKTAKNGLF
jgi:hypothetical protein